MPASKAENDEYGNQLKGEENFNFFNEGDLDFDLLADYLLDEGDMPLGGLR
jgi:hypothetical protein